MTGTERREKLKRELRREALTRLEDAARTIADFENVTHEWDTLDENRERRERYYEKRRMEELLEWNAPDDATIVPLPLDHVWWRQMMRGDFLDTILNCPYDIHELTSSRNVSELLNALRENQKEILYLRAIRQYSPQQIAAMRGQSDRNIRKVHDTLIASLRKELAERLYNRWEKHKPLTLAQRAFMDWYCGGKNK